MKRKVKVWGKLKIFEASAVGIPAYPDAHASSNPFSLIKALSNASLKPNSGFVEEGESVGDELNMEVEETMEDSPESVPEEVPEKPEEPVAEEPVAEEEVKEEPEKKANLDIAKAIREGIKEGLKELETNRGLVETNKPVNKSLGELAIEKGLFQIK